MKADDDNGKPAAPKSKFYVPPVETTHALDEGQVATGGGNWQSILIVDDDAELVDVTRMLLEAYGFIVDTATDGVGGIKKLMERDYAVIICDMVMPNLAGDMFYRAVERIKPHLCKRFLFVTGNQGDRKITDFIRSVHGLALWKPFPSHVLVESIQAVIKKAEA